MLRRSFFPSLGATLLAPHLAQCIEAQAQQLKREQRACILVWLAGAPSQIELWDPKPGTANGGDTKAIQTKAPGVSIAHFWPKLAQNFQHAAVIRTLVGKEAAHDRGSYHLRTGRRLTGASQFPHLGSVVASEIGDPRSDLPNFVSVGSTLSAGFLGVRYAPFELIKPGELPDNVAASVPDGRLARRLEMLSAQNADFSRQGAAPLVQERQTLYARANQLMHSPRLKAFQLTDEPQTTRDAYGGSKFGQGLLVARRLVEAGIPFIEVQRGGWDMHNDLYARMGGAAGEVDQGLAALLGDLHQRGMLDKTLVVCLGEFGRTPKLNSRAPNPGRDHWIRNFNALLAGAGVRGGRAIGKTNPNGQEIADRPVQVEDLFQTICHALRIDGNKELFTPEGRPLKIVDGGSVVTELFA